MEVLIKVALIIFGFMVVIGGFRSFVRAFTDDTDDEIRMLKQDLRELRNQLAFKEVEEEIEEIARLLGDHVGFRKCYNSVEFFDKRLTPFDTIKEVSIYGIKDELEFMKNICCNKKKTKKKTRRKKK